MVQLPTDLNDLSLYSVSTLHHEYTILTLSLTRIIRLYHPVLIILCKLSILGEEFYLP